MEVGNEAYDGHLLSVACPKKHELNLSHNLNADASSETLCQPLGDSHTVELQCIGNCRINIRMSAHRVPGGSLMACFHKYCHSRSECI